MLRASALLALAVAAASCATGATFDGRVFRDGAVAFEMRDVPPSYRRIELAGASLAFRDEPNDASIIVKGRCGVASDDAPLEALTNHLLIGTTEREFIKEETVPFDGREARHTVVRAKLDGVPRTYGIYVLKKDGCVYDFVRVAPNDRFEPGADEFRRFVGSFHALGGASKGNS